MERKRLQFCIFTPQNFGIKVKFRVLFYNIVSSPPLIFYLQLVFCVLQCTNSCPSLFLFTSHQSEMPQVCSWCSRMLFFTCWVFIFKRDLKSDIVYYVTDLVHHERILFGQLWGHGGFHKTTAVSDCL